MSNHISSKDLEKLYRGEIKRHGKSGVDEIVKNKRNSESQQKQQKSIFLCHSHHDRTVVEKIALFFNKIDVNIYIDWMDEAMPKVTNRETAEMIRAKIQHSNRFLFLATYYGLKSKWCDWELGVAYSIKRPEELAILPIESKSGRWEGSEYLQLYPVMRLEGNDFENINASKIGISKKEENKEISLEQWLTI